MEPDGVCLVLSQDGYVLTFKIRDTTMNPNGIKELLLYSLVFNYATLMIWFGVFSFAHDWMCHFQSRWFRLSAESFNAVHYISMALYKIEDKHAKFSSSRRALACLLNEFQKMQLQHLSGSRRNSNL